MKEQEEIEYINKHKKKASEFYPEKLVVPVDRAISAINRAYIAGVRSAHNETSRNDDFASRMSEYHRKLDADFNSEDYE